MTGLMQTPADLPRPVDDGACNHLPGLPLPDVTLASTRGTQINLRALPPGRCVIFCYPMTGQPSVALPEGWDAIPGARGCTPQACSFRDSVADFAKLGVSVFGVSTQTADYQREMAERLHLPYDVLSDAQLEFARALNLPVFEAAGAMLIKRLTLISRDGVIEAVLYPVFPTDQSAAQTLACLRALGVRHQAASSILPQDVRPASGLVSDTGSAS